MAAVGDRRNVTAAADEAVRFDVAGVLDAADAGTGSVERSWGR